MCLVRLKALFHTLSLPHHSPGLISTAEQPQEVGEAQEAVQGLGAPAALDTHTHSTRGQGHCSRQLSVG